MADWVTISSLATAAGTLVLSVATFAAVRSANRSARTAERAFAAALRPVLVTARPDDPEQRLMFQDRRWLAVRGAQAAIETDDGQVLLALALRNVGPGLAVLDRWAVDTNWEGRTGPPRDPNDFHRLTRDLYIAAGDVGFWQGAIREPDDPDRQIMLDAIAAGDPFTLDLLYADHEGGQRTISRFALTRKEGDVWAAGVIRHSNLDRPDPR
jgi:hypothetical protein